MATIVRAATEIASRSAEQPVSSGPLDAPRERITRLVELHGQAAETAGIARLVERATYAVLALGLGASVVAAQWDGALGPILAWLILMGAGLLAAFHAYDDSATQPLDLAHVRPLGRVVSAIMLYTGLAWGAASFLLLPGDASLQLLLVLSAGASALIHLMLRAPTAGTCFLIPATLLPAMAVLVRPAQPRLLDAAAIIAAGLAIGLTANALERNIAHDRDRQAGRYPFY